MAIRHRVQQGECLASIAAAYGFVWETIWNDVANASLRRLRDDPFALLTGDEVVVPDLRPKQAVAATGKRHVFRLRNTPVHVRVRLLHGGMPRKKAPYVLVVDDELLHGTTDDEGRLEHFVRPNVRELTLWIADERYDLLPRRLDPATTPAGAQTRLRNLGFYDGPWDGKENDLLASAIRRLQAAVNLEVTGVLDDATAAALDALHASSSVWQLHG